MKFAANLYAFRAEDPTLRSSICASIAASQEGYKFGQSRLVRVGDWVVAQFNLCDDENYGSRDHVERSIGAHTGEIFIAEGYEELASQVGPSRRFASWNDLVDFVVEAPGKLNSLPGDFAFIAFSPSGQVLAVRSCAGNMPIHLMESPNLVCISTRIAEIVRFSSGQVEIDPLVWAAYASGCTVLPDNRSFLRFTSMVPFGYSCLIEPRTKAKFIKYFDPVPSEWPLSTKAGAAEHCDSLRNILLTNLRDGLSADGINLLALSGGVDSSCIGALAVQELGLSVASVSLLPPPGAKGESKERYYVESLGKQVNFREQLTYGLDLPALLDLVKQVPDVGFPVPHSVYCGIEVFLRDLQGSGSEVRVIFGGEHADEVCGSYVTLPDWAMATRFRTLLGELTRLPMGPKDLGRWLAWRIMWLMNRPRIYMPKKLLHIFAPELQEEYVEWRVRHIGAASSQGAWPFLSLWRSQAGWVSMGWEVGSSVGLRRVLPFLSRQTLELVYSCNPSELVGPGPKKLLRGALEGLVPASHLYRPDKGSNIIPLHGKIPWTAPLSENTASLISPSWQDPPKQIGYPEIFPLTLLERASRSLTNLAGNVQ